MLFMSALKSDETNESFSLILRTISECEANKKSQPFSFNSDVQLWVSRVITLLTHHAGVFPGRQNLVCHPFANRPQKFIFWFVSVNAKGQEETFGSCSDKLVSFA